MRQRYLTVGALCWLLSIQALAACPKDNPSFEGAQRQKDTTVQGPFSVAALERENTIANPETGQKVPFGLQNEQWKELKAAMKPGDKIYFISRSQGRFYIDGHVLVSEGCVTYFLKGSIS
jgi:hypothetical protein